MGIAGENRYSPDQPRNPDGTFGEGGGRVHEAAPAAGSKLVRGPGGKDLGDPSSQPKEESVRRALLGLPAKDTQAKLAESHARAKGLIDRFKAGDKSVEPAARQALADFRQTQVAATQGRELSRDEAHAAIARLTGGGAKVAVSANAPLANNNAEGKKAGSFIASAISADSAPKDFAMHVDPAETRAHASPLPGAKRMTVSPNVEASVIVHEFGHIMEAESGAHFEAAADFLARRAGGQPPKKLSEITGNKGYGDKEKAIEDHFENPYDGKIYRAEGRGSYRGLGGSEITSRGLEYMHNDPVAFAKNDPDFFRFTLAQMTRKATPRI